MEVQVNVAQDNGEHVEGDYQGKRWHGWSDGLTTWKPFRIPFKANSDPEYTDSEVKFDLAEHCDSIGMTGWDWANRCSRWVAFDFDAIVGHSEKHTKKLSSEELDAVRKNAEAIEWVTIRKSTAGKGIHLYVFLDNVPTKTHTEHAALGRAILGKLAALTGFDFMAKVDTCGGNMWVWARKMVGTDGLKLIKPGTVLTDIPPNWRDHVKVVSGSRRKNLPQDIEAGGQVDAFQDLVGQRAKIQLDDEHKKLITYLKDTNALWWWDQDNHMLVTHTMYLKKAHADLGLRGVYETNSEGKDLNQQNCFATPMRRGAWAVRRFGQGVQEHESWTQDPSGWTKCFYNREADLQTAARAFGGLEDAKGNFNFREGEVAMKAAQLLGVHLNLSRHYLTRETKLKSHKDGRLVATVERKDTDRADEMPGWLPEKDKWTRIYATQSQGAPEVEVGNYDDMIRHLVTDDEDAGWMIKSDGQWRHEPLTHCKIALSSMGLKTEEVTGVIGNAVMRAWKIVNKPFQPEYPGDREWNRGGAQFRFIPTLDTDNLSYPTWQSLLKHCGEGLNETVANNTWCKAAGLKTGSDYLRCWIASLFKEPTQPLPYLFFYSKEQNTGKSSFHEALTLLLTRGVVRSESALTSSGSFNGELEGAIVCVVEEIDLRQNKTAYNRIKDWVTSREISIHPKNGQPYMATNTTHWIQCSNDHQACPIFGTDTRITMVRVNPIPLEQLIPKKLFISRLEKEAPDFLADIMQIELPQSNDRLNLPALETQEKAIAQELSKSDFEVFLEEKCVPCPGSWIKFSQLYEDFIKTCDPSTVDKWSKIRVGRELPTTYPKGRNRGDAHWYVGNIAYRGLERDCGKKYVFKDGYLDLVAL
jgi:hypothetical protein